MEAEEEVGHARRPAMSRPRRAGPLHTASAVVLIILLLATAVVTIFTKALIDNEESRLLTERANEIKLILSASVTNVSQQMSTLARLAGRDGVAEFDREAKADRATTSSGGSWALLRPSGSGFAVVDSVGGGLHPGQNLGGVPARTVTRAQHEGQLVATPVFGSGASRSIGFALSAAQGLLVYHQVTLGPVRAPSQASTAPFSELGVVLYAGSRPEPAQVIVATTTDLPLHGPARYVPLAAGASSWLVGVDADSPLVGSAAAALPWLALAAGVVGSLLVVSVVEATSRRRDAEVAVLDREHRFAESLQRRLLGTLPVLEGLDVATAYVAGSDHQQVGGDWFDLFPLGPGRAGIVIGDVMGHDVEAAATMAQVRASLRSYAAGSREPDSVVERLGGFVDAFAADSIVTVVYGILEAPGDDGSRRFRWVNAGHLPPLLRLPDGTAEELSGGSSPLLGAPATASRPVGERTLPAGSTLLFYTDGLVESQRGSLVESVDHLRHGFSRLGGAAAQSACRTLLDEHLPQHQSDDTALLVVRLSPGDQHVAPAADPPPAAANGVVGSGIVARSE